MLTTIICAAMAVSSSGAAMPHWLEELIANPPSTAGRTIAGRTADTAGKRPPASESKRKPLPETKAGATFIQGDGRLFQGPAFVARFECANEARKIARLLLDVGKYEEAYAAICRLREEHPDVADLILDVVADCANLTGRHAEAYQLVLKRIQEMDWPNRKEIPPRYLLAISVASAGLGRVYEGQADYCRERALAGLKQENLQGDLDGKLVRSDGPQTVAILSCLALGFEYGSSPYLEMALQLDPVNTNAAGELCDRYQLQERKADVLRVAARLLENLPLDHPRRGEFERRLAESE